MRRVSLGLVAWVFFGPLRNPLNKGLQDLTLREGLVFAPLVILVVWMGVAPGFFLQRIEPAVAAAVADVQQRAHSNGLARTAEVQP